MIYYVCKLESVTQLNSKEEVLYLEHFDVITGEAHWTIIPDKRVKFKELSNAIIACVNQGNRSAFIYGEKL